MPACPQHHRQATGRFSFVLMKILGKKSCMKHPVGILLLWKGCGTMGRHYLLFTATYEMLCCKTVIYKRDDVPVGRKGRFGVMTAIVLVCLSFLLLCSGNVELNPGPVSPEKNNMQAMYQCIRESIRDEMKDVTKKLKEQQAAEHETLKASQERQTERLEKKIQQVSDTLSDQLERVERTQGQIEEELECMRSCCDNLLKENQDLKKEMDTLRNKCDSLENHSRRNNLLFVGLKKEMAKEDWNDCEQKVRSVIREGMGIEEEIAIERAHRMGRSDVIIAKFLSYKSKILIMRNAKKLKNCEKYQNVFVREDFSETVRTKRQGLREMAKTMYDSGQRTRMKFDKLLTEEGVFTYDIEKEEVVRLGRDRETGGERRQNKTNDKADKHSDSGEQETGSHNQSQSVWDLDPWSTESSNRNPSPSLTLSTAEYPSPNQYKKMTESQNGNASASQRSESRGHARAAQVENNLHSSNLSPVMTRQRASSVNRTTGKTSDSEKNRNTLQQWMSKANTQGARGGRGVDTTGRGDRVATGGGRRKGVSGLEKGCGGGDGGNSDK